MGNKEKGGKKGRKIGRMKRKPAHTRYNNAMRWEINAEKRQAKHKKMVLKKRKRREKENESAETTTDEQA